MPRNAGSPAARGEGAAVRGRRGVRGRERAGGGCEGSGRGPRHPGAGGRGRGAGRGPPVCGRPPSAPPPAPPAPPSPLRRTRDVSRRYISEVYKTDISSHFGQTASRAQPAGPGGNGGRMGGRARGRHLCAAGAGWRRQARPGPSPSPAPPPPPPPPPHPAPPPPPQRARARAAGPGGAPFIINGAPPSRSCTRVNKLNMLYLFGRKYIQSPSYLAAIVLVILRLTQTQNLRDFCAKTTPKLFRQFLFAYMPDVSGYVSHDVTVTKFCFIRMFHILLILDTNS